MGNDNMPMAAAHSGIRGRERTRPDYMNKILTNITVVGGLYLAILSLLPPIMIAGDHAYGTFTAGGKLDRSADVAGHPRTAERSDRDLLFRWHVAADRCGRGDGYGEPEAEAQLICAALRRIALALKPGSGGGGQCLTVATLPHGVRHLSSRAVPHFIRGRPVPGKGNAGETPAANLLRWRTSLQGVICSGSGSPAGMVTGLQVASLMQAGSLVPDETVNRLVEERIEQSDCEHGFILDRVSANRGSGTVVGRVAFGETGGPAEWCI